MSDAETSIIRPDYRGAWIARILDGGTAILDYADEDDYQFFPPDEDGPEIDRVFGENGEFLGWVTSFSSINELVISRTTTDKISLKASFVPRVFPRPSR